MANRERDVLFWTSRKERPTDCNARGERVTENAAEPAVGSFEKKAGRATGLGLMRFYRKAWIANQPG
jgi:hypothetical protein